MNTKRIADKILKAGIFLLAVSIPFSLSLMSVGLALLFVVLVIKIISKEIELSRTGLEKPLFIFLTVYILSALMNPDPAGGLWYILTKFWYLVVMYEIFFLFEEKEMKGFIKILSWSAAIVAIFAVGQSLIGLNFSLEFSLGESFRMKAPVLKRVFENSSLPIYHAVGLFSSPLTFGAQMLMLLFIVYAYFEKSWQAWVAFAALLMSFSYSAWFGFAAALSFYYFRVRKKTHKGLLSLFVFIFLLFSVPGNFARFSTLLSDRVDNWKVASRVYSRRPLLGVGPTGYQEFIREHSELLPEYPSGMRINPESIYLRKLTYGGLLTFIPFIYLLITAFKLFKSPSKLMKERWKRVYYASCAGLGGIFIAGFFHTYLTDAVNSVIIWTFAGLLIKLKNSRWAHSRLIPAEDID